MSAVPVKNFGLDVSNLIVFQVDEAGCLLACNQNFRDLIKDSAWAGEPKLVWQYFADHLPVSRRLQENVRNFWENRTRIFSDEIVCDSAGRIIACACHSVLINDSDNKSRLCFLQPGAATEIHEEYDGVNLLVLRHILEHLPGHVYWKDKNGVYLGCNDKQAKSLGFKYGREIIGKTDQELPWPKDVFKQYQANDELVMRTGRCMISEEHAIIDGKEGMVLSYKLPLMDDSSHIQGIVGLSIDITKQKQFEQDLQYAKQKAEAANDAKTQFMQNMEHDLRTPSSGIAAMLHIIEGDEKDPEKKALFGHMRRAADQLLALLNNILEFDHANNADTLSKKIDIKELVSNVVDLEHPAAHEKSLELIFECDENIPKYVLGDESKLFRILLNLIGNAIKFTQRGFVRVSASVQSMLPDGKIMLQFQVQDTGIGIPKEKQQIIYEKFVRGTPSNQGLYPGTGLGLSIVKQFIGDLGGEIELQSDVDKGALFICTIPFNLPVEEGFGKQGRTYSDEHAMVSDCCKEVLLVEDDLLASKFAASILEKDCRCAVDLASTGQEALKKALEKAYDFIFMDLGLPDMCGEEVVSLLRQANIQIPIVALTAHSAHERKSLCLDAGMNDFLSKPLTVNSAREILNKLG